MKAQGKSRRIEIAHAIAVVAMVIFFSMTLGCSNVRLSKIEKTETFPSNASGKFCSVLSNDQKNIANVIFIVDMSDSNINAAPRMSSATDRTGLRFQAITSFLDNPCSKRNPNNKFAIIGFSGAAFGQPNSCARTRLVDADGAKAQLKELSDIQDQEKQYTFPFPPTMKMANTNYVPAIKCAADLMRADITADRQAAANPTDPSNESYMFMFLSDGGPTDQTATSISLRDITDENLYRTTASNLIGSEVDALMAYANSNAQGARFQTIMYGAGSFRTDAAGTSEKGRAEWVMSLLSQRGDSIFQQITQVDRIPFCELFNMGSRTAYTVSQFGVVNLTAKASRKRLLTDSDMDGIVDDEEVRLGFDPTRPRSKTVFLDGLCPKGQPASSCISTRPACTSANAMGLSECDIETLALGTADGIDDDKDDIPSLIEILKGARPNDSFDRLTNTDGDGLPLLEELRLGRDPFFSDDDVDPELLLHYRHDLLQSHDESCPAHQEFWSFDISHIPLVKTLGTNANDTVSRNAPWLTHAENENVILIYYIVKKANEEPDSPTPRKIYGQFVKASPRSPFPPIDSTQFKELGVIDGQYKAKGGN